MACAGVKGLLHSHQTFGSLLIAALLHFQLNNPIWPDAQPWDNLLIALIAIILVWLKRRTLFQRGAGVTDILMPGMPE